jgi:predicted sulfurtransferase
MDQRNQRRVATIWVLVTVMGLATLVVGACNLGRMFPDLNASELKKRIDDGVPLLVIDLRSEEEYRAGRIPRALNVAPNQLHLLNNRLPRDKKTSIVFYCRGSG